MDTDQIPPEEEGDGTQEIEIASREELEALKSFFLAREENLLEKFSKVVKSLTTKVRVTVCVFRERLGLHRLTTISAITAS